MNRRIIERVKAEIKILEKELHGNASVKLGIVEVRGKEYLGVIVPGLRVNPERFGGIKAVSVLVLLPPEYPYVPPIGIYLDRPYDLDNEHFSHLAGHGAPTLVESGWYWFCYAFGGFNGAAARKAWRPKPRPEDGHNLATVIAAARVVLNS